ncbi:MAG: hypothetical protein MUQ10_20115 [Anaerolineae bacterium]|nr:hypothetical protein [Anaerolineae bacterium]
MGRPPFDTHQAASRRTTNHLSLFDPVESQAVPADSFVRDEVVESDGYLISIYRRDYQTNSKRFYKRKPPRRPAQSPGDF